MQGFDMEKMTVIDLFKYEHVVISLVRRSEQKKLREKGKWLTLPADGRDESWLLYWNELQATKTA